MPDPMVDILNTKLKKTFFFFTSKDFQYNREDRKISNWNPYFKCYWQLKSIDTWMD